MVTLYYVMYSLLTYLSMFILITHQTMRLPINRNVFMSRQRPVTVITAEVLDVPRLVLGTSVFHSEDQLVTGAAARDFGVRSVVTGAKQTTAVVIVKQVNKNFLEK